jgi:hypothetical protein
MSEGRDVLVEGGIEQCAFEHGLADIVERDASDKSTLVSDNQTGAQTVVEALFDGGNQGLRRIADKIVSSE